MEKYIFIIYIFIIGTVFGSLFNVCILRIPNKQSISNILLCCYNCDTKLKYVNLISILTWIFLKGKCKYCRHKISSRYTLIKLLTGILFVMIYNVYGLNFITINYLVLISLLIIITFIDIDHYIIPDSIIIFGSIFAVLFDLTNQGISIKESIIGGIVCGGGMLILISLIELVLKKEVMGGGDIKLLFMIGLFLGIKLGLLTILISIYAGAFYGILTIINSKIKNKEYNSIIPYGPFISVGAFITVLCGTNIINLYMNLFI